jgi:hypothetical protein
MWRVARSSLPNKFGKPSHRGIASDVSTIGRPSPRGGTFKKLFARLHQKCKWTRAFAGSDTIRAVTPEAESLVQIRTRHF